ncbi:MAG: hypothetical protein ACE5EX_02100 [Phycisphaerae bacterium]
MSAATTDVLLDRLCAGAAEDGRWGYRPGSTPAAEPTAVACLALGACDARLAQRNRALTWLARLQRPNGAVPITADVTGPCWPTALALLAWLSEARAPGSGFHRPIHRAASRLLELRGIRLPLDKRIFGHDTTLQGWPWVSGTHSWVEPTAFAISALRTAGRGDHPHVREAVRLLLDRALPEGGWNYGNTRVLSHYLRPFPATTGIALTALAGEADSPKIAAAASYLSSELEGVRSPLSMAWGVIGLTAVDRRPPAADDWLRDVADRAILREADNLSIALLLLARCAWRPASSSAPAHQAVLERAEASSRE